MSLENKIQELQRKLEVKKAYTNVRISFGHQGKSLADDVKEEVSKKLTEIAIKLAEDQEILLKSENNLTDEEITILKQVVSKILNTSEEKPKVKDVPNQAPVVSKVIEKVEPIIGKVGRLMLLDNIDATIRRKIEPESEVKIMAVREDLVFVQDKKANRFYVPIDDLEFI